MPALSLKRLRRCETQQTSCTKVNSTKNSCIAPVLSKKSIIQHYDCLSLNWCSADVPTKSQHIPQSFQLYLPFPSIPPSSGSGDVQSVIVERPQHTAGDINTHFSCSCQNKGPYEKRNASSFLWHWLANAGVYFRLFSVPCTYRILKANSLNVIH